MERVERKIQAVDEWLRREQDFLDGGVRSVLGKGSRI